MCGAFVLIVCDLCADFSATSSGEDWTTESPWVL